MNYESSTRPTLQWIKRKVGGKIVEQGDGLALLHGDLTIIRMWPKGKLRVFQEGKPHLDFRDTKLLVEYLESMK